MLRMFIPTSSGKISRRRYIFSFILTNFIFAFLIIFFNDGEADFLVIVSTIVLHYLVINMNCQRLREVEFRLPRRDYLYDPRGPGTVFVL